MMVRLMTSMGMQFPINRTSGDRTGDGDAPPCRANYNFACCQHLSVPKQRPECQPRIRCCGRWWKSPTITAPPSSPSSSSTRSPTLIPPPISSPAYVFPGGLQCDDQGHGTVVPGGAYKSLCISSPAKAFCAGANANGEVSGSQVSMDSACKVDDDCVGYAVHVKPPIVFIPIIRAGYGDSPPLDGNPAYEYFTCLGLGP